MRMQRLVHAIYPATCVSCGTATADDRGLCGSCWGETAFVHGLACDKCGTPLPGSATEDAVLCDDCLKIARPWDKGRTVFRYEGVGRRLVLGLKHGDRTDLVPTLAGWMQRAANPMLTPKTLIVPVPLHWTRLIKRRYNQAALLARAVGKLSDRPVCVDALQRLKRTKPLEGHSRDARFAALNEAISPHPKRKHLLASGPVLLIDDVMTSGATLAAAAEACRAARAPSVNTLTLARVGKDA